MPEFSDDVTVERGGSPALHLHSRGNGTQHYSMRATNDADSAGGRLLVIRNEDQGRNDVILGPDGNIFTPGNITLERSGSPALHLRSRGNGTQHYSMRATNNADSAGGRSLVIRNEDQQRDDVILRPDGSIITSGIITCFRLNTTVLSAGIKNFVIDHPLDPENRSLVHASVESSEMANVYSGNAHLDNNGEALVELPAWLEALNKDFRYQLTCIGQFAPVYVAEELANSRFKIAGGKAGMKVSWQLTGIRRDPLAQAHPLIVDEEKPANERGYYRNPEVYNQPEERAIYRTR